MKKLLLVLCLVIASCESRKKLGEQPSPSGKLIATIYKSSRGATASGDTIVSMKRLGFIDEEEDVYIVRGNATGSLLWKDDSSLVFSCTSQFGDHVTYVTRCFDIEFSVEYHMPRPIRYLVPDGFTGPAVVAFGHPFGKPLPFGLVVSCQIGDKGVLRTSDQLPAEALAPEFVMMMKDGSLRQLYAKDSSLPNEIQIVATDMTARNGVLVSGFLVGIPKKYPQPESILREAMDQALDNR